MAADLGAKCVELIRVLLPSARRVAVLANAPHPFSKPCLEKIRLASETTKTTINPIMIRGPEQLDAAFLALERDRPGAVIVQPSLPIN